MNLQTSFLTPPFGFALFYLRSVAAKEDYKDRVTGATIPAVTTAQIYKGSIAFIVLQLIMVACVIAFPSLVTGGVEQVEQVDVEKALEQMMPDATPTPAAADLGASAAEGAAPAGEAASAAEDGAAADDPMKALEESIKKDAAAKK
jgi:hypothetical protein